MEKTIAEHGSKLTSHDTNLYEQKTIVEGTKAKVKNLKDDFSSYKVDMKQTREENSKKVN